MPGGADMLPGPKDRIVAPRSYSVGLCGASLRRQAIAQTTALWSPPSPATKHEIVERPVPMSVHSTSVQFKTA
jgi:hypothetical protein